MNLRILTFSNEQAFTEHIRNWEHDSCSFSADMTPNPAGYHAYSITGTKKDISAAEGWIHQYAMGRWLSYRFVRESEDTLCIEFL